MSKFLSSSLFLKFGVMTFEYQKAQKFQDSSGNVGRPNTPEKENQSFTLPSSFPSSLLGK